VLQAELTKQIAAYNTGRDPERLKIKYSKMAQSPFSFLRGTAHLFYDGLPEITRFAQTPLAWNCGDLHFENFGCYRGDNHLVYFDINDFDEAALAPCIWDLERLLTSILVGGRTLDLDQSQTATLCHACVDSYAGALASGKSLWIERETATGQIGKLLEGLRHHKRVDLLNRRTRGGGSNRRIIVDGKRALPATDEQTDRIRHFMAIFAATQENPGFFRVLDVARRIAGTGSLGLDRFVILVRGKNTPDGHHLLDLKEARPSVLSAHLANPQPRWHSEADRIVSVQRRMQAVTQAMLNSATQNGKSYVLRDLQPSEDRVKLSDWNGHLKRLEEVIANMGRLLAWAQLRSNGRQGSAVADALMVFGGNAAWKSDAIRAAGRLAKHTVEMWHEFRSAWRGKKDASELAET
jgi:uncharacterized protein (DUF2252 family)